jgi:uncharacterized protein (TIGR04255 family)
MAYTNPPLREVYFELQFAPSTDWPATLPGEFFAKIKDEFPVQKQRENLGVHTDRKGLRVEGSSVLQFYQKQGKVLYQLGPRFFTANALASDYIGWKKFFPRIKNGLNHLQDTFSAKPKHHMMRLSYVNSMEDGSFKDWKDVREILDVEVKMGHPNEPELIGGAVELIYAYANSDNMLHLKLIKGEDCNLSFELNYFNRNLRNFDHEACLQWLERAHLELNQMFERIITDKARKKFA